MNGAQRMLILIAMVGHGCQNLEEKMKDALETRIGRRINPTSNTQLINMYGITEITVVGTYHDVTHQTENAPSIGRPLPNSEIYILE